MIEILKGMLQRHEGLRLKPYHDSKGILTIGIGRNLERGISREEAYILLDNDLKWVLEACHKLEYWPALNDARAAVVANMMFNLGEAGFLGFRRMNAALNEGQWKLASEEMLDSRWAEQVGGRALELSGIMERGRL